ncbi:MAG TPA: MXAN_6640 family putative metalloprotease [Ignavibacteriaceae bacterium]|nr:MXAN_6640 family putative metalloprotease [Ignavibacteriaceae bacterium]
MNKILILFLYGFSLFAQVNTDSLYNAYIQLKTGQRVNKVEGEVKAEKCGFLLSAKVKTYFELFNPSQQQNLAKFMQRPDKAKSIVSPRGYFRVHYDETGDNPKYSLDELLTSLDSVYNFEVNYLGFPAPPVDNGAGGDNLYDIYISDLGSNGSGLYGYTELETSLGGNKYITYMVIDDDYVGYFSAGINGARVTVAHEYHHAIQVGDYLYRDTDSYFYELTSTSMEEFVYDNINDYYAYIDDYLKNPNEAFGSYSGYEEVLWNIYLSEKLKTISFVRAQWELMPQMRALNAIDNNLQTYNTNFRHEFNEFGVWAYFTNYRKIPGKYFEEGGSYSPALKVLSTLTFSEPQIRVDMNVDVTSNTFLRFTSGLNSDSLVSVISNAEISKALDSTNTVSSFTYELSRDSVNGYIKLTNGYYNLFTADNDAYWALSEILNNTVVRLDSSTYNPVAITGKLDYAFPNPFYYIKNYDFGSFITITVPYNNTETAELNIYTSSMDLVFSERTNLSLFYTENKNYVVRWNALDKNKNKLKSGVYIYVIKSGDSTTKGKLVIFND